MNIAKRFIKVYDKNMEIIAIFSNDTYADSVQAKKNLMVAPTIDIVSNGESTLTFTMLANSEKWQQIKNPENIYECDNRYYTALNENSIIYSSADGEQIATVTLVETWYLLKYKYIQIHNTDTKIEAMDDHTVKILPKTKKTFKLTINGTKYEDSEVKDSRGILMPRGSAGYALWAILKASGWNLGICDVLPEGFNAETDYGTFNVESDMKSALENIQLVQELYGGILVWDSKNKTCSLRDETIVGSDFNRWKGFTIRKKKNLSEPPEITWDNNLITRLYPLGNGNLNIKKVNSGKGYVDDFSYTDKIYEGYLQNANIYHTNDTGGQKVLKEWGKRQLAKLCKPRKSVKYNIIDLRGNPKYSFETFDINDIVKAYYENEKGNEVSEEVRVQHINYNYFFPTTESTVEVGDKVANEIELFHLLYKADKNKVPTDSNGYISFDDVWGDFGESEGTLEDFSKATIQSMAEIYKYADDNFATIDAFTLYSKQTDEKFVQSDTRVTQISNELSAQVTLEANHYEETKEGIKQANASIDMVADDLGSEIDIVASNYNGLSNEVAAIRVIADDNTSAIELQADTISVQGELIADKVSTADFNSEIARVENLIVTRAEIKQIVSNYISGSTIDVTSVNARAASIDNLTVSRSLSLASGALNTYTVTDTSGSTVTVYGI